MHSNIDERQRQTADRLRRFAIDSQLPYAWPEFQRRARLRAAAAAGRSRAKLSNVSVAAALLLLVGTLALVSRTHSPAVTAHAGTHAAAQRVETGESRPEEAGLAAGRDRTAGPERASETAGDPLARARVAERWLASLPPEPVIVRFGTRVAVTGLEDRIAQLDDLLTAANFDDVHPVHRQALQQERGRLITTLAQVRLAEALAANAP